MATMIPELESYVGGSWRRGSTSLPDINPADPAKHVATTFRADVGLATEAIDAASSAAAMWAATTAPERGDILRKAGDLLDARAEEVGSDLTREEGKTKAESVREVRLAARIFRYYAGQTLDPDGETFPSHQSDLLLYRRHEPVGVVSAITPWNFPISLPSWKLAAALAFGNVVVWKPATTQSFSAHFFLELLEAAGLPPGVINMVTGNGLSVSEVALADADLAGIHFTGSTAVFRTL
jgi:aldehyde dehydrogenase (NAD+)